MRTFVARTLLIASLASIVAFDVTPAAAADIFPDKNLETAVRALIFDKKDPAKELTDDDLKKVYVLEAKGKGIRDLRGLEKCTSLQLINFAKNEISDLTPLKDLKQLQSLDLSHNKITDAAPLAGLVGLQFLELSNNEIKSVEPLGKLTKLSALYMANNKVAEITPLGELTRLSSLDLAKNEVADIKPVSKLTGLFTLKLSDNKIEDISPIPKRNTLKMLFLERNKITDLSPLVTAAQEDAAGEKRFAPFLRLYVEGNPLSDAAKGQQFEALKTAGVRLENATVKKP
jgi:Leucine-rich repeat (LRR) protein